MSPNSRIWIAAIAGIVIGAGAIFAIESTKIAEVSARVTKADADAQAAQQRADELQIALAAAEASLGTSTTSGSPSSALSTAPPAPPAQSKKPATTSTAKQFTYISKVNTSGGAPVITADYAQMLTGKAAAAAATAHGDESPPPNDYYIVNDNKMLRKLKVEPGITVTVTTNDDGTADPTGHIITFDKWSSYYAAPDSTNAAIRDAPYWITLKNGIVTRIAEQYLP